MMKLREDRVVSIVLLGAVTARAFAHGCGAEPVAPATYVPPLR